MCDTRSVSYDWWVRHEYKVVVQVSPGMWWTAWWWWASASRRRRGTAWRGARASGACARACRATPRRTAPRSHPSLTSLCAAVCDKRPTASCWPGQYTYLPPCSLTRLVVVLLPILLTYLRLLCCQTAVHGLVECLHRHHQFIASLRLTKHDTIKPDSGSFFSLTYTI